MITKIDFDRIAEDLGFEQEELTMLVGLFLESSKEEIEKMKAALDRYDLETIYKSAHTIKGSSGNLYLQDIFEISKFIELNARKGSSIDYKSKIKELESLINAI